MKEMLHVHSKMNDIHSGYKQCSRKMTFSFKERFLQRMIFLQCSKTYGIRPESILSYIV